MDTKNLIDRRQNKNQEIRSLYGKAKVTYLSFFKDDYKYSNLKAIEELGLDKDLINQLVEDYVSQIIKSIVKFEELIYELQENKDAKKELDYTELRDLAHKNLGVARNLRVEDAESILNDIMTKDDLEYLFKCIEVLQACAIRLAPECAFNTIKLIEVKSSF